MPIQILGRFGEVVYEPDDGCDFLVLGRSRYDLVYLLRLTHGRYELPPGDVCAVTLNWLRANYTLLYSVA